MNEEQLEISREEQLLKLKKRELAVRREQIKLEKVLPHLHVPMYSWQREFFDSKNRVNLLTAANQIGKSSILIRRQVANCTDPKRWRSMYGLTQGKKPTQIWYFYPDGGTVDKEIDTKWVPEILPRGEMERHPQYGWKLLKKGSKNYSALEFNAGPTIYFQMYTRRVANIQAGTVYEVAVDEELPMSFYDEVMFRLTATGGIFSSVFTPTLNQLFWKQAMETDKVLTTAYKKTVSMYECLKYEDGTPSRIMTLAKIKNAESKCKNATEKQRRIYGRFVTEAGLTYFGFEYDRNVKAPYSIKGWNIYASVDYGSGLDNEGALEKKQFAKKNHPAAITYVAVRPDFKKGVVFRAWRGDFEKTTAGDVFLKYEDLSKDIERSIVASCYDPAAVDFGTIASRNSRAFQKADKTRDKGIDLLNTLFKHDMLDVFDDDPEVLKLASELMHVMESNQSSANKSGDDLCDSLRYNVMQIPWDLSAVRDLDKGLEEDSGPKPKKVLTEAEHQAIQIQLRRGEIPRGMKEDDDAIGWGELEAELEDWNVEYGG